jgi:hypothetical protein
MDKGCTQPLSSDPMINLNTTVFPFCLSPVCEESPQLRASRPYNEDHKRCTEVREGRATHTRLKSQHNHAHKSQLELKTQLLEFTTQMELKLLSQRIKCVKLESWRLRMFLEKLGCPSMRLRVPFIAPRQLGAVVGQQGRLSLPYVGWHGRRSGADLFPFLAQTTVADSWQYCPVHTGQSGAPADRWRGPRVARELRGRPLRWRPLAHRTVRCTTAQSGEL